MKNEVFLDAPNLGDLEKSYLLKALDGNYVSTAGPFVSEFEERFANYLNVSSCVSTQSGTAALHMALYELGIGPGDEVILPALTFAATINAVIYVGATPVIVDVDEKTWNICPFEIERALTKKTKAILPVHLYGNPCAMGHIMDLAKCHKIFVVEDATESLGATYQGRLTGTYGEMGCFSFNGNKVITTGGGGMLSTNDFKRGTHVKSLVNQARDMNRNEYYHLEVGFNYRMTNLEAALGLAQIQRLADFLAIKRRFNDIYSNALEDVDVIQIQSADEWSEPAYWLNSVTFDTSRIGLTIPEIQNCLKEKGIPTRRIFPPLIDSPPYKSYKVLETHNARQIFENGLSLPSSTLNDFEAIKEVAEVLVGIVKRDN